MVLFEVNPEASQRLKLCGTDGACQLLRQHGYQLFSLDERGELMPATVLPEHIGNLLAIPQEKT